MDNLCHTLVGAACGEAGLKRRTRFGNATLMIASNIPDLDVLVFVTSTSAVAFRRGWTHGVLAQALLPAALTAVMLLMARARPGGDGRPAVSARWLLLLSYLGVFSHVFLDLLNSYGIRLLMPFQPRWFYGDTLFIIDPWLWIVLGAGVWIARRRAAPVPARRALVIAAIYIAAMGVTARAARAIVFDEWRSSRAAEPRALMVGPVPADPFHREVIVDAGGHYETGTFSWLTTQVTFDPEIVPKRDDGPLVARAREAPQVRGFLVWSRFPFWTLEPLPHGTRVSVSDVRFANRGADRFTAETVVAAGED
jgi:inner membrane protein